MLHLARRITLGVNVRDLFQLQRTFERDREVDPATKIKKIRRAEELLRKLFDAVRIVEQVLEFDRQLRKLLRVEASLVFRERATQYAVDRDTNQAGRGRSFDL
jgi:hypothetical protein